LIRSAAWRWGTGGRLRGWRLWLCRGRSCRTRYCRLRDTGSWLRSRGIVLRQAKYSRQRQKSKQGNRGTMHRVFETPGQQLNDAKRASTTSFDATSSSSDGSPLGRFLPPNLRESFAIQKQSRASALHPFV
jgi:hypothetical protein